MDKRDMVSLIEVEDDLDEMDKVLEQLTGMGHGGGKFIKLDYVFNVIYHNSHPAYSENPGEGQELFFHILTNRAWTAEQRADILMNGTVREIASGDSSPI